MSGLGIASVGTGPAMRDASFQGDVIAMPSGQIASYAGKAVRVDRADVEKEGIQVEQSSKMNSNQSATQALSLLVLWLPGQIVAGHSAALAMLRPLEAGTDSSTSMAPSRGQNAHDIDS